MLELLDSVREGRAVFVPLLDVVPVERQLDPCPVPAGFPSPAGDYEEVRLDIGSYLMRNPVSTFFFTVSGQSMRDAGIQEGDILVVDKSITPVHGHIVIAFVDGLRLVKRLYKREGRVALVAANPDYPTIELHGEMEMTIWGVVIGQYRRIQA